MTEKLFGAALVAVLTALGLAISSLGWAPLSAYVVAVVGLLVLGVRRQRAATAGRTCTCCTTTVHDEVKVV